MEAKDDADAEILFPWAAPGHFSVSAYSVLPLGFVSLLSVLNHGGDAALFSVKKCLDIVTKRNRQTRTRIDENTCSARQSKIVSVQKQVGIEVYQVYVSLGFTGAMTHLH